LKVCIRTVNKEINETFIVEEQIIFRRASSHADCASAEVQIFEKEYTLSTFIAFIDNEKAFDRTERNHLWKRMFQK
jgi:hypothetical protein